MDPRDEEAGLPGDRARQRSSIPSFLFISFMLFMLTSHNGDEFLARHQYQDALRSLTYQLSNYTAWMNGTSTNFTVLDQDLTLTPILDTFNIQGRVLDPHEASYYSNVTGFIHGSSNFHNITPSALADNTSSAWNSAAQIYMTGINETEIVDRLGTWNWTASDRLALSVVEKLPTHVNGTTISDAIALVHGRIELTDANTREDFRLEFEGVHFILNGSIYGIAEPTGLLPSLVPASAKNETAQIIEPELTSRINKLKKLIDAGIIDQDSSSDEPPKSSCPFTFYAQIHPVTVPEYLMQELEDEIQKPTGVWTIDPPKLSVTGLLVSKECGIMFEVNETEGLRSRTFFRKVTTYAGFAGLVYLALLITFSRQTERSRTPSGLSRVSRWLFLSQATIDSVSFAGHITFAILAEGRPSLSLVAPAFLACVLFVYEAQFSVLVHQIQVPEDAVPITLPPIAARALAPTPPLPSVPPPNSDNTYPPTPAPTSAPPAQAPPALPPTPAPTPAPAPSPEQLSFMAFFFHHIRTDPQARLWVTLFIFLTFIVRVILSPTLSMVFVSITYSLIWLPQIIRSARRGRSSGLSKEYIIGTTACRLYLALYFLACPKNVLDVEPRSWSYLLAALVCFQAIIVLLQEILGPAFFLPQRFVKVKTYEYHPPMPLPDSEAPEQSLGDCAICMDAIIVESRAWGPSDKEKQNAWDTDGGGEMGTRQKSLGSARLFTAMQMGIEGAGARKHTECLEKWLAIKNICPQCRRPLPPL
ncbi:hypothetical protein D9615_003714 [Tricholomella constricta]|uniref:RING-type E3 ubiquitin transferase n=1 Tax=Tricholomella constricta TaxID=117010 RepID=A0A8H5HI49_9AGAR|nr:hypothetical protein D9615_003714 [Tricholomella constricta]